MNIIRINKSISFKKLRKLLNVITIYLTPHGVELIKIGEHTNK